MDLTDGRRPLSVFVQQMKDYYTGAAYSAAYGYEGPGVGVGNGTYSIGTYDQPVYGVVSGFDPATAGDWQAAADAWENWFRANAPDVERFKYMTDEPLPEQYPTIQERASWIHSGQGPGKDLDIYTTVRIDPELYGYVDFWSLTVQSGYDPGDGVAGGYVLTKVAERKALGEKAGFYNGTRPAFGQASALDAFATENRVNPWIGWKYGADQYFLWEIGYYAGSTYNVWDNQYLERGGGKYWGDGDYLYAGEDGVYPGDSRGVRGPIASIRMKNWRRGQQDYEYLWLARECGIPTTAIVDGVVPAAFDDYKGTYTDQNQQPLWSTRGYQFEDARREVAELLAQSGKTALPPDGTLEVTPQNLPAGGGEIILNWTSTGAVTAWLNNGIGDVPLNGSPQLIIDTTTTFILILTSPSGTTVKHVTVPVGSTTTDLPAGSIIVNPTLLPFGGGEVTLVWSSTNALSASISNGVGFVPVNGSTRVRVDATTTFILSLSNAMGTIQVSATVVVAPSGGLLPAGSIAADPTSLPVGGGDVTLVWSSTGATTATLGQGIGAVPVSGSMQVNIDTTTTFVLTVTNNVGSSQASVTIGVGDAQTMPPAGSIVAHPTHLPGGGGEVTLVWSSTSATDASINNGVGPVPLSGSRKLYVEATTTFELRLSNSVGTATDTVTVHVETDVSNPPDGSFAATPSSLPQGGGEVLLEWSSTNASRASIDNGIGEVPLNGSKQIRVDVSTLFILTLENSAGTLAESVLVSVAPTIAAAPTGTLDTNPATLPYGGGAVSLTWSSAHATDLFIDPGIGSVPPTGVLTLYVTSTTTYTLTATNDLGTDRVEATVTVDSSFSNIVSNSFFESGTSNWVFQTNGHGSFGTTPSPQNFGQAARVDILSNGDNIKLHQSGLPFDPDALYALTFSASSTTGHDLEIVAQKDGEPYTSYGLNGYYVDLTTEMRTYTVEFSTRNFTQSVQDGRLMFWLTPYAKGGDTYLFDNVVLTKLSGPGNIGPSGGVPPDYFLDQNFPNPFNPSTVIRYMVPDPAFVTLRVYDVLGREVVTLVEEEQPVGRYEIEFVSDGLPSGVYLYVLKAGAFSYVRKMLLVR
jgi:hypothetical protein